MIPDPDIVPRSKIKIVWYELSPQAIIHDMQHGIGIYQLICFQIIYA